MKLTHSLFIFITITVSTMLVRCNSTVPSSSIPVNRQPLIYPDYRDLTVAPNIAPLNFFIKEPGSSFFARVKGLNGKTINVRSKDGRIFIPIGAWRKVLSGNRGKNASVCIYARNKEWKKYQDFTFTVSTDTIDPWVAYRVINICAAWNKMAIMQRDLRSFDSKPILHNTHVENACINCHSFRNGNSETMLLQMRHIKKGTPMFVSKDNGRSLNAVNTKTAHSHGKAGFTAWHPTLPLIAFTLNNFSLLIHSSVRETRDVFDGAADMAIYNVSTGVVSSNSAFSDPKRLETMPCWSPDGKYLYFSSGPRFPEAQFASVKCDIMRIAFDSSSNAWGKLDTVLTSEQAGGGSVTQPSISPDGKFVLVNISDYSNFPVHQERSDLALYVIADKSLHRMPGIENRNRSWHSWSRNSRWIAFTSKELDGRFGRIWLCHIDSAGKASKAFPIPQKDPLTYASMVLTNNFPELLTSPVRLTARDFNIALGKYNQSAAVEGTTGATVKIGIQNIPSSSGSTGTHGKPFN